MNYSLISLKLRSSSWFSRKFSIRDRSASRVKATKIDFEISKFGTLNSAEFKTDSILRLFWALYVRWFARILRGSAHKRRFFVVFKRRFWGSSFVHWLSAVFLSRVSVTIHTVKVLSDFFVVVFKRRFLGSSSVHWFSAVFLCRGKRRFLAFVC